MSEALIEVNWKDFREHLPTADQQGKRLWLYPKKPEGRFYQYRKYVSWLLLAVLFVGPFVRINGNPLLLVNIIERRFSILGRLFWPQDVAIFAIAMLLYFSTIILFTSAFGRLWCGWACPQTLLMEMLFRRIEYVIEGDSVAQRALAAAPWTAGKTVKRLLKHGVFFALSFLIANTLLSYIIGTQQLFHIITDDPRLHLQGLFFMLLFTALFYGIFARFREQACTFICPYGRFQSAMLDENSMVVAYDHKRGEKRGHPTAGVSAEGLGDCVDCHKCVAVCPTGIDIRNGTQMECVNCTACIDACDSVMDKLRRPRGLIRYASHNIIERGEKQRFTPRMAGYSVVITVLATVLMVLVFTRPDIDATVLRAPGALSQMLPSGKIENLYTVQLINKTSRDLPLDFVLENTPGIIQVMGAGKLMAPAERLTQTSLLIQLSPNLLHDGRKKLTIGIYSNGRLVETVNTAFIGPRNL